MPKIEIVKKVRRLLGKCHVSMIYCDEINCLLDDLDQLVYLYHIIIHPNNIHILFDVLVNNILLNIYRTQMTSTSNLFHRDQQNSGHLLSAVLEGEIMIRWLGLHI